MKFYFVKIFDGNLDSGVNKKIIAQIKNLNDSEIQANLILIGDVSRIETKSPYIIREEIIGNGYNDIIHRFIRSRHIAKILREKIKDLQPTDILYIRYPLPITYYPVVFLKPFRKCKVIFEYNTIESKEFFLNHNYLDLLFEFFFGMFVRIQADGGVGVTDEITNYQKKKISSRNKPFITIANGIDVNSIPLRSPPKFIEKNITIICVANLSPWHGIDRLIRGIAEYSGEYKVRLLIVGEGSEIDNLKNFCKDNKLKDRITFYGFVSGKDLDNLFNESDVAVGPLGMHRTWLNESTNLKIREYCARGIPFFTGNSDPDLNSEFPYSLKMPSDESEINIDEVISFTKAIYEKEPNHHLIMREFAQKNLDWSHKIAKFKKFLRGEVIQKNHWDKLH